VKQVSPDAYINDNFDHAVYCQLGVLDYNHHKDGIATDEAHFLGHPEEYKTGFTPYLSVSDIFVSCHFWDPKAPKLFTKEEVSGGEFKIQVIADISCDIDGSVPTTLQASTIEEPFYGFNRTTGEKGAAFDEGNITIMAVDNLPCELPRDASKGFGREMLDHVIPLLIEGDKDGVLDGARETGLDGELCEQYRYLEEYVRNA